MGSAWNFSRYLELAQQFLARGRLPALLLAVTRKAARSGGRLKPLQEDLGLLRALCVAWWRGDYRQIEPQTLLAVVAALLYFLTPVDAVPDWVLMLGLLDDLAVLGWVLRRWHGELDGFRAWREAQAPSVQRSLEQLPSMEQPVFPEKSGLSG